MQLTSKCDMINGKSIQQLANIAGYNTLVILLGGKKYIIYFCTESSDFLCKFSDYWNDPIRKFWLIFDHVAYISFKTAGESQVRTGLWNPFMSSEYLPSLWFWLIGGGAGSMNILLSFQSHDSAFSIPGWDIKFTIRKS